MGGIFRRQQWVCARAVRALPQGSPSVDPASRAIFEQWTPPQDPPRRQPPPRASPCRSPSTRSTSPSRSAATGISRRSSIRSAAGRPAIRRSCPTRTASPKRISARLPATLVTSPLTERARVDAGRRRRVPRSSTARRPATTSRTSSCRRSGSWLRHAIEDGRFRAPADPINPVALLERLTQVEAFERFLHRSFPGKTRFSIEGLDMLVPILDEVIGEAAEAGHRPHAHRHGAPRPPQRDGARAVQAVRADPRRVQGSGLVAHASARTWRGPAT